MKLLGVSAYVDLQWTKKWSSAIGYSFTKVDNTNFQDPTAFHKGEYASVNLLWTPADPIMTGPSSCGASAPTMTAKPGPIRACNTPSNGRSRARTSGTLWMKSETETQLPATLKPSRAMSR